MVLMVKILQNQKYDPSKCTKNILLYDSFNPDLNFHDINIKNPNTRALHTGISG